MATFEDEKSARYKYSVISGPVSPYDEEGRIADIDLAHEIALKANKSMSTSVYASKIGNTVVARFAELRAEMHEIQHIRPMVASAFTSGMSRFENSNLSNEEQQAQISRLPLYIDLTNRRNASQDESTKLVEDNGGKYDFEQEYNKIFRDYESERRENQRELLSAKYARERREEDYQEPLRLDYIFHPEDGVLMRKDLNEVVLDGMNYIGKLLLERYATSVNSGKSIWGSMSNRVIKVAEATANNLIERYHGTLGDFSIVQLPLDDEGKRKFVEELTSGDYVDPNSVTRVLMMIVQGGSTKKEPTYGYHSATLYVRHDPLNGDSVQITHRLTDKNENTESLSRDQESRENAARIEAAGLAHPLSGGLPSLGKTR